MKRDEELARFGALDELNDAKVNDKDKREMKREISRALGSTQKRPS